MTCLEKYKLMHPKCGLIDEEIIHDMCPDCTGIDIMDEPDWCPHDTTEACTQCWNRQLPGTEPDPTGITEAVNHPKHYGREGAMECIDEMVLVFGVEATMNFCLLNAWKYRYRAGAKGGDEDLKKSDWYLAKYAELKGGD
jgi:hypothetical protein